MRPRTPPPARKFHSGPAEILARPRTSPARRRRRVRPVPPPFQNVLGGFVQEVSDKQAAASDAVAGLLSGKNVSLHQAMISMEEASVSFQLMVEVRNRLLDSYQELMRMQV